jgi:hypothetical protein
MLSVDFPPVTNVDNQHYQLSIPDFIKDAIIPDSDSPAISACQSFASRRPWIVSQIEYRDFYLLVVISPDFLKRFLCPPQD